MTFSIKKTVFALTLASLAFTHANAQSPTNVKEIRNELGIMLNILQASLKQNANEKLRFSPNSVTYLVDQGAMFEISNNSRDKKLGINLGEILNTIVSGPAMGELGSHLGSDFDEEQFEETIRSVFEQGEEFMVETREKMRALGERQRDISWEQREYERTRRDLEFEKRSSDGERREEVEKELTQLNKELKKIEAKRIELENYAKELSAEQNQLANEREAAKKQFYSQSFAIFEDTVGSMLCRYGAGLKSLPDNENVSFVLSHFVQSDDSNITGGHDKIYVFKNKDVKACVTGKINKEQLLSASSTYIF